MKFFLAAFLLGVTITRIEAVFKVTVDELENREVADAAQLTVQSGDEVKAYAKAYAEFREVEENATKEFQKTAPEGSLCLFTIKMAGIDTGTRRVIKLDHNGVPIEHTPFKVEGCVDKFTYNELGYVPEDMEKQTKNIGKQFITDELSKFITEGIEGSFNSVAYARIPFLGKEAGQVKGWFMLFVVIYS